MWPFIKKTTIPIIQYLLVLTLLGVVELVSPVTAEEKAIPGGDIYVLTVSSAISPAIAEFISDGISKADGADAACLIIRLDTPGGLAESMRHIIMDILSSRVPIVVYVSPPGARAASAGVMITMAADIAAMAPGTNIGAAHPVGIGGKEVDETMTRKITNDMVAHARSVAEKQGRNADWVEKAVRESVSVTETEALEKNIIDVIARDLDDLIQQINGRKIKGKGTLILDNAQRITIIEGFRTRILKTISDPNIAYILMMIGLAGLYFELSHPGAIFPGVIGGICLVLAFFALQTLPVNYAGILLIVLAMIFFIMEMKITSYGLLSVAGIVSLLMGSLMLFDTREVAMRVSWQVLLPTLALVSGFFVVAAGLVFRAQKSQPRTGSDGLIGEIGVVSKKIDPEGKVLVHGELWLARANIPLNKGEKVRVVGVKDLAVEVEPISAEAC
jgi:membrane-bound serine protease (ClpP class)